jgi:hypothetical protein
MSDDQVQTAQDLANQALAQQDDSIAGTDDSNDTSDEVSASNQVAETVMSLQNLIERHANKLDEMNNTLKQYREQLKNIFENDAQLSETEQQLNAMSTQVKARKSVLMSDPQVVNLKIKIGEINEEKKETEEALSDHLVNYYSMTNSKSFDTSDGDQREFQIRAKVSGKRKGG